MRKNTPIEIIMYFPKTDDGKRDLAQRVSGVHADFVSAHIQKLNCPAEQKMNLLNSVISKRKDSTSKCT